MDRKPVTNGVALVVLLTLVSCADRPAVLSSDAAGETLRWSVNAVPFTVAEGAASVHCAASDKRASLEDVFLDDVVEIARFACR